MGPGANTLASASWLQWGRDQLIAEMATWAYIQALMTALQWGRDQLIAEILIWTWVQNLMAALQWGRDQLIAEILPQFSLAGGTY